MINSEQNALGLQIGGKNAQKAQDKRRAKTSNSNNLSGLLMGPQESIPYMYPLKNRNCHKNIATIQSKQ